MPGRREPSKAMVRRLAEVAPEKLLGDIEELRRDRDALKQALAMKVVEYAKKLTLLKSDILILKPPATNPMISTESLAEVGVAVAQSLKTRMGWEGSILIEAGARVEKMPEEEEKRLLAVLKNKHEEKKAP